MSPLQLVWLTSALGALAFLAIGYVLAAMMRGPRGPQPLPAGAAADPEASALRASLRAADERIKELSSELAAMPQRLGQEASLRAQAERRADDERARSQAAIETANERVRELERELRGQGDAARSASGAAEQRSAAEAKAQATLQTKLAQLQKELEEAKKEGLALGEESKRTRLELEEAKKQGRAHETASAQETKRQAAELRARVTHLEGELHTAQTRVADLKAKLATAQAERAEGAEAHKTTDTWKPGERAQLQVQISTQHKELERQKAELERLRAANRALEERAASETAVRAELAQAQAASRSLQQDLHGAAARADDVERLRDENSDLRQQLEEARARRAELAEAETQLRSLRQELQNRSAHAEEATRLSEENSLLRAEIAELGSVRAEAAEAERLRSDLSQARIELDTANRRCEQMDALAAERTELEAQVRDLQHQAQDLGQVREHLQSLRARMLAAGLSDRESTVEVRPADELQMDQFSALLKGLVNVDGVRSAVVAESSLGLTVAALGDADHHEGMAALSGLAMDLAERTRSHLPMGQIREVRVEDDQEVSLSWRLFHSNEHAFALAVLSVDAPIVEEMLDACVMRLTGALRH